MVNVESFWWWWCRVKAVGSCLRHCKGAWPSSFIHFIKTVLWFCFGKATLQVLLCRVLVKWPKLITDQLTSQFILCPGWSTSVYCRVSTCGKWRKKLPALRIGLTVLLPSGSFRGRCVTHLIAGARMIFLGKTRVGHRQSDKHFNGFKGNVRETSERVERIWAFSSS